MDLRDLEPARVHHRRCGRGKGARRRQSLLPAGVSAVDGAFERGDTVTVKNAAGRELGRGLIAYSTQTRAASPDAARVKSRGFWATVGAMK